MDATAGLKLRQNLSLSVLYVVDGSGRVSARLVREDE